MSKGKKESMKVDFKEASIEAGYKACKRADPGSPVCDGLYHQAKTGQITTDKYLEEVSKVVNHPPRPKTSRKKKDND